MSWSNDPNIEEGVYGSWSNRTLCIFKDKTRFGQNRNKANIVCFGISGGQKFGEKK